jgi:hypothetical protein
MRPKTLGKKLKIKIIRHTPTILTIPLDVPKFGSLDALFLLFFITMREW